MLTNFIIHLFQSINNQNTSLTFSRYFLHTCFASHSATTWSMHSLLMPKTTLLLLYSKFSSVPNSYNQHYTAYTGSYSLPTTLNKPMLLELLHSHLSLSPLYMDTIDAPRQSTGTTLISKHMFDSLTNRSNTAPCHLTLNATLEIHPDLEHCQISFYSLMYFLYWYCSFIFNSPNTDIFVSRLHLFRFPNIFRIQYLLKILGHLFLTLTPSRDIGLFISFTIAPFACSPILTRVTSFHNIFWFSSKSFATPPLPASQPFFLQS